MTDSQTQPHTHVSLLEKWRIISPFVAFEDYFQKPEAYENLVRLVLEDQSQVEPAQNVSVVEHGRAVFFRIWAAFALSVRSSFDALLRSE